MNKPIKAKNLPLFSIIDLDQLRREKHLEGTEVTDFFTARDGKVYLLMEQPSETQGKDWLSTPSTYTAVEIQLDWAEQRVLETNSFPGPCNIYDGNQILLRIILNTCPCFFPCQVV